MSRVESLAGSLRSHLEDRRQAEIAVRSIFNIQGSILEWVQHNAARIVDEKLDTPEERAAIRDAALKVFDEWDIPRIDGFVETAVKAALRPALAEIVNAMLGFSHELLVKAKA